MSIFRCSPGFSFLLGFITLGIVGGIIALVVIAVVEGIAQKIGGTIIRDEVTGEIKGIGAWPQTLEGIGEITTRFENPIEIDPSSILFGDEYIVRATFASVTDALANAKGPYVVPEGSTTAGSCATASRRIGKGWTGRGSSLGRVIDGRTLTRTARDRMQDRETYFTTLDRTSSEVAT